MPAVSGWCCRSVKHYVGCGKVVVVMHTALLLGIDSDQKMQTD